MEVSGLWADGLDDAGHICAGIARIPRIHPQHVEHISKVEPDRLHSYQHLQPHTTASVEFSCLMAL